MTGRLLNETDYCTADEFRRENAMCAMFLHLGLMLGSLVVRSGGVGVNSVRLIRGVVTDGGGAPLKNAGLTLFDLDHGLPRQHTTTSGPRATYQFTVPNLNAYDPHRFYVLGLATGGRGSLVLQGMQRI